MLSLYVHIPFCARKCHYCGFYSTVYSPSHADEFISAFRTEAAGYEQAFSRRKIGTVYLGGGTPTVLSSDQLKDIFAVIKACFSLSPDAEYTVEANPDSLSAGTLTLIKESGIDRLSLGIQSFSDDLLVSLGRPHNASKAEDSFISARNAGFGNIGIDLIYGIPSQSPAEWKMTLNKAVELKPEHISLYSLSLEEGSRFMAEAAEGRLALPDDESAAEQYELAVSILETAGYEQYEISNFCLPGFACRHNINYWERGQYLGLGPGAWSFISGRRFCNAPDLHIYSEGMKTGRGIISEEDVTDACLAAAETVMLGLRMSRGLDLSQYEREYGGNGLQKLLEKAEHLKRIGLLEVGEGRLRLSKNGFLLANEVLERLCL